MFSFFRKKAPQPAGEAPTDFSFLGADMHSHLLPGVDDGAPDAETSLAHIRRMKALGWSRLITTPHVHLEFYDNNFESLQAGFAEHKRFIAAQEPGISLGIAAEYYLDNLFLPSVMPDGLLHFGNRHVLVEVSMAGWPRQLDDSIFSIIAAGYTPVLAHPERYVYESNPAVFQAWKDKGVLMAMNLLAPAGYYGPTVKALSKKYMEVGLYDYCGSDVHHERHLSVLERICHDQPELMRQLEGYGFKNTELLHTP